MNLLKLTTQTLLQHVQNMFINMTKEHLGHLVPINQMAVSVTSLSNIL